MRSPGTPIITVIVVLSGAVLGRVVRVPPSPLLRVEGTDVAISCNVSDYEGPREQNFEWRFSSGAGPAVNVLSTWDGSFTQDSYLERVRSGGVRLERIGNSEVLLHVQDLRASDGGNYTCITPSTDATYRGNYEDQVQIKVIADPLRVAAPRGWLSLCA
ncbi:prostaglandin F2 receptor negative regulator-like [Engystomops pustulosus]|uniref:prostaglandin F2 receptor negative regulator-like n=1 Tax=Engystomops pustulosus TaxID=76066 RepID=UPI003AFACFCD